MTPLPAFGHLQTWFHIVVLIGLADDEMTKAMTVETIQVLCTTPGSFFVHLEKNWAQKTEHIEKTQTKKGEKTENWA